MTNFMRWLCFAILFLGIWLSAVTKKINHRLLEENPNVVLYFPIIAVGLFGVYAMSVVLWRVYAFNDCEEEALELKNQIEEAKADLKKKGFKFDDVDDVKKLNS